MTVDDDHIGAKDVHSDAYPTLVTLEARTIDVTVGTKECAMGTVVENVCGSVCG